MKRLTVDEIETASRSLVTARESSLGVEITTPVVYPNGQCVIVAVIIESGVYVVHDAGLGAMYLTAEGVRISTQLRDRLSALAARYGCDFIENRMTRRCSAEEVAVAAMLVANASRSIGDQAAEMRRQTESFFREVLTERVREIAGNRFREGERFKGASGQSYRVGNVILDDTQSKPIAFIMPLPSRSGVASLFRELYDLRAAHSSVHNETVYDENSDFRHDEDGWILKQVGDVGPFGQLENKLPRLLVPAGAA